jgi:hypothetical protein
MVACTHSSEWGCATAPQDDMATPGDITPQWHRADIAWQPQKQTAGQPSSGCRPQSGKRVAYFR